MTLGVGRVSMCVGCGAGDQPPYLSRLGPLGLSVGYGEDVVRERTLPRARRKMGFCSKPKARDPAQAESSEGSEESALTPTPTSYGWKRGRDLQMRNDREEAGKGARAREME